MKRLCMTCINLLDKTQILLTYLKCIFFLWVFIYLGWGFMFYLNNNNIIIIYYYYFYYHYIIFLFEFHDWIVSLIEFILLNCQNPKLLRMRNHEAHWQLFLGLWCRRFLFCNVEISGWPRFWLWPHFCSFQGRNSCHLVVWQNWQLVHHHQNLVMEWWHFRKSIE